MSNLLSSGWAYLVLAIVLEVVATWFLKLSNSFEKLGYAALAILLYCLCFFCMAPAYKALPAGVVYAIWSGLGIVGITALGIIYFEEQLALHQFFFVGLICAGAIGLSLTTNSTPH